MKLSELPAASATPPVPSAAPKRLKLSDLPPENPPQGESLLSKVVKPLRSIPGNIASEFRSGEKMVSEGLPKSDDSFGNPLKTAMGGLQEVFSPAMGIIKSLWTDPVEATISGPAGKVIGKTGEAALSFVGPVAVAKALGVMASSLPGYTASVRKLLDAGVQMTPGQISQGLLRRGEDASRSLPIAGSAIAGAQRRSMESFNRAVINESLKPIGQELPATVGPGREAIAFAGDAIGAEYDKLVPKLRFTVDPDLVRDVTAITQRNITRMNQSDQARFGGILNDLTARIGPSASMSGRTFKEVESELSYLSRQYRASPNPSEREFAHSVDDLGGAMRDALERGNPTYAPELRQLNGAWAIFKRAQGASINRPKSGGVFTPADLLADIKRSTTKGAFARGDGLIQGLADAGNEVLPQTIPDSGTAERRGWAELFGLGSGATYFGHPGVAAGIFSGAAPYTKPGMAIVNRMARQGSGAAAAANQGLSQTGAAAAAADVSSEPR